MPVIPEYDKPFPVPGGVAAGAGGGVAARGVAGGGFALFGWVPLLLILLAIVLGTLVGVLVGGRLIQNGDDGGGGRGRRPPADGAGGGAVPAELPVATETPVPTEVPPPRVTPTRVPTPRAQPTSTPAAPVTPVPTPTRVPEPTPPPGDITFELRGVAFRRVRLIFEPGDQLRYRYTATGNIDFRVEDPGGTPILDFRSRDREEGVYNVATPGEHILFFENRSAETISVKLAYQVER